MAILNPDVLSLDPIPMPRPVVSMPEGEVFDFIGIVHRSGMKCVVTNPGGFHIVLIPGNRDLIERRPGLRIYGIGRDNIPDNDYSGAREILRRLAYSFQDWAAREVVSRYHRDLKRAGEDRQRLSVVKLIQDALSMENGATIGRLSRMTGVAQPNISRAVSVLARKNIVHTVRDGRESLVFLTT